MRRSIEFVALAALALSLVLVAGTSQATVFDAYTAFQLTSNVDTNMWQYMKVAQGANTGYELDAYTYTGSPWHIWCGNNPSGDGTPLVGADSNYPGTLVAYPSYIGNGASDKISAALGWKSPGAATATVTFSASDLIYDANGDGAVYALFKEGGATALSSGFLAEGAATGNIVVSGISLSSGTMLYLQIGNGTGRSGNDEIGITMSVNYAVPEPGTIVLLGTGLIGLICYVWRKRR